MLLQEKALFRQHFYKSISALTRLLPIDKNFAQIFVYEQRERYFKTKLNLYAKKKNSENFSPRCDSLVTADENIRVVQKNFQI